MEERIAKHKPRSVLTKEKKYTSLHVREAVGKNRKKIKTVKYEEKIRRNLVKGEGDVDK